MGKSTQKPFISVLKGLGMLKLRYNFRNENRAVMERVTYVRRVNKFLAMEMTVMSTEISDQVQAAPRGVWSGIWQ